MPSPAPTPAESSPAATKPRQESSPAAAKPRQESSPAAAKPRQKKKNASSSPGPSPPLSGRQGSAPVELAAPAAAHPRRLVRSYADVARKNNTRKAVAASRSESQSMPQSSPLPLTPTPAPTSSSASTPSSAPTPASKQTPARTTTPTLMPIPLLTPMREPETKPMSLPTTPRPPTTPPNKPATPSSAHVRSQSSPGKAQRPPTTVAAVTPARSTAPDTEARLWEAAFTRMRIRVTNAGWRACVFLPQSPTEYKDLCAFMSNRKREREARKEQQANLEASRALHRSLEAQWSGFRPGPQANRLRHPADGLSCLLAQDSSFNRSQPRNAEDEVTWPTRAELDEASVYCRLPQPRFQRLCPEALHDNWRHREGSSGSANTQRQGVRVMSYKDRQVVGDRWDWLPPHEMDELRRTTAEEISTEEVDKWTRDLLWRIDHDDSGPGEEAD